MEFPTWSWTFLVFHKDWINQSIEYEAISCIQNTTYNGLSEQSYFTFNSYKMFVKRFYFCVFKGTLDYYF